MDPFDFGVAIRLLQTGAKVARKGWNGQGMFLYYVPAGTYPALTDVAKKVFGDEVSYEAYIAIKPVGGIVSPWVASQVDILTADWYRVE